MTTSSGAHAGKLIMVVGGAAAFIGAGVFVAWLGVNDLPAHEQSTGWMWFAAGWFVVTAVSFAAYLPGFLNNKIAPQSRRQQTESLARAKRFGRDAAGITFVASALGLLGPGFGVAIGAVLSGLFTFFLGFIALHLFTEKGRGYRARQLKANARDI